MSEECIICKAPLEYLEKDEEMECAICHKKENSKKIKFAAATQSKGFLYLFVGYVSMAYYFLRQGTLKELMGNELYELIIK